MSVGSASDSHMTAVPTGSGGTNEPSQWQSDKQPPPAGQARRKTVSRSLATCSGPSTSASLQEAPPPSWRQQAGAPAATVTLGTGMTRPHKGSRGSGTDSSVPAVEKTKKERSVKRRHPRWRPYCRNVSLGGEIQAYPYTG
ncbi:hypothetical protein V8E55_008743 [Tylopilus felleus]